MPIKYSKEQREAIQQISTDFESLQRHDDVDYGPHDKHQDLNLDQLLPFWKYRISIFSSNSKELQAPVANVDQIVAKSREIHTVLKELLSSIPNEESATDYLNSRLTKLIGEKQPQQRHRQQNTQTAPTSLLDEFNALYWRFVPDGFKFKEVVREIKLEKSSSILSSSADLKEAYCKSETQAKDSFRLMSKVCALGLVLLGSVLYISAVCFSDPLPFQTTLPINVLILLYCSVSIRRYLIDAKNRDLAKVRLRDFNALPKLERADPQTQNEIVKNWYLTFNRTEGRDQSWADILKPLVGRLFSANSDQ